MGGRGRKSSIRKNLKPLSLLNKDSFRNEFKQLPNDLKIGGDSVGQYYAFVNLNRKPTLLQTDEFEEFVRKNKDTEVIYRAVDDFENISAKQIMKKQFQTGNNYWGGRVNGIMDGEGSYFSNNKNVSKYGEYYVRGVMNKKTAKIINHADVHSEFNKRATQKQKKELNHMIDIGLVSSISVKASMLGYNVIERDFPSGRKNYNVLDRNALIIGKKWE